MRWEFVIKAYGWSFEQAFHYVGYGDHYETLEGALETFLRAFPEDASRGYNVYLRGGGESDSGLLVLFTEDGYSARQKLSLLERDQ